MEGLEKIASDLRVERTKATNALRDRARLKVENESLHQELKEREDRLSILEESMADLKEKLASSRHDSVKLENDFDKKCNELAKQDAKLSEMKEDMIRANNDREVAVKNLQKVEEDVFSLREENELLKGKLFSAEKMQRKMEAEASEVVILKNTLEEEHTVNLEKLHEKSNLIESMKDRIATAEALELSYKQLKEANEGLKAELDSSIKAESKLSDSARKYAREYTEKSIAREMMSEELSRLKKDQEDSRRLYKALEQANTELKGRIQAELEGHEFTKQRADNLQTSVDSMRSELGSTSRTLDDLRSQNSSLEMSLSKCKVELKEANETIISLRVSSDAVAKLRMNLADAQKVAKEGEEAKSQLFMLKKQMTKATLEGSITSNTNNMNHSFSAGNLSFSDSGEGVGTVSVARYEEMVKQMNSELGACDDKLQATLKELSEAQERIRDLQKLEEELELTKAAAEDLSREKQEHANAALEATERSVRMLASKEGAVREVMARERELEQSKRELEYARGELSKEVLKNKTLHNEKLSAERQAAEKAAVCSKMAGELESAKNSIIEKEYELEHHKRRERELEAAAESARLTLWQFENRHTAESSLSAQPPPVPEMAIDSSSNAINLQHSAVALQLEQAEYQLSMCHREIESLKENVAVQRRGFDNALEECTRLYEANRRLKSQLYPDTVPSDDADGALLGFLSRPSRDVDTPSSNLRDGLTDDSVEPSQNLLSVRKELNETMSSMKEASTVALHKNKMLQQLQTELEEEKSELLAMQDKFTALADREAEMVHGKPIHVNLTRDGEGKVNLEEYADKLVESGVMKPPISPMGMMPFSSPTLGQSMSKMATAHLSDTKRSSELYITRSGVVVSSSTPHGKAMGNNASSLTEQQLSSSESKSEESRKSAKKSFEADVKMIKSRKGTASMTEKAINHRRRLETNHQKERELRKEAMQAVRKINRYQLQSGAVPKGQSASSSPIPALKQILPQRIDIHQAHKLLKGNRAANVKATKDRVRSYVREKRDKD